MSNFEVVGRGSETQLQVGENLHFTTGLLSSFVKLKKVKKSEKNSDPTQMFIFWGGNCVFCVFFQCFPMFPKKKLDRGVGWWCLNHPSFSLIFRFF